MKTPVAVIIADQNFDWDKEAFRIKRRSEEDFHLRILFKELEDEILTSVWNHANALTVGNKDSYDKGCVGEGARIREQKCRRRERHTEKRRQEAVAAAAAAAVPGWNYNYRPVAGVMKTFSGVI